MKSEFDIRLIGTPEYPIRASSLPKLTMCPWRTILILSKEFEDIAGAAAHTGTAVHKAIELYHRDRKSFDDTLAEALAGKDEGGYPLADADETRLHFRGYYGDPRNTNAGILHSEKRFNRLTLTHPDDPEETLTLSGTFDQIRFDSGLKILYDIKTGKSLDAYNMLMEHTLQLVAYWLGAESMGIDVDQVGIIYTYGYRVRGANLPSPDGVFLRHPVRRGDRLELLKGVFRTVRLLRLGVIDVVAGAHCSICPARSIATCLPILQDRIELMRVHH